MWMVYALATLLDVNKAPYAVEAHEYYLLSRLALRYAPPAHDTTLIAIQTMVSCHLLKFSPDVTDRPPADLHDPVPRDERLRTGAHTVPQGLDDHWSCGEAWAQREFKHHLAG